ncbi:ATP-binding protein [Zavarzinella formosa]|uniref:ATP-binding protein n=1 Tax=Zavarzinella formosa TaxID=360055 RepID=UPI00037F4FCB|nr:MoxR family ATPase [Zavarzinella formosa]
MRPMELVRTLAALIPTRRPVYLWGQPGIGKSSLVRQAANANNLSLVDVRATLLDPVDLRGLPSVVDGTAVWCPPAFLPKAGKGLLFLDELAQAPPLVQAACLQLTLDRKLGEYELPEGWSVIAAGNRGEDRAGTHRLISPLLNRFVHLDVEVSADDWQAWAVTANVAAEVRAFLRFRPGLLFEFKPESNQRAFPTPRSWSFVSDTLKLTPAELLLPVVAGCVGEGPAAEFVAFLRLFRELPDIDSVLTQPATSPIPREPAVLYALAGALVERCRQGSSPLANFVTYATRLPEEFALLAMRDALALNAKLASLPAVQGWIRDARARGFFTSV